MRIGRPDPERVEPFAYRSQDPTLPGEINNVDVDMEAAKLAENQLLFMYGVKFIQERKADVTAAITGNPG
jgi:flagellar basal-body rod protein FlgB